MSKHLQPHKYQYAFQDNNLVRTALRMSILELRIFYAALSDLNTTMTVFPTTLIPARDFIPWLGNGESYEAVHTAIRSLVRRVLDLVPANQKSGHTHAVPLMAEVKFVTGDGVISVTFNEKATPYLLQLKGNYTITDIAVLLRFKNPNSVRLFSILHSYANKGSGTEHKETISLDDLKCWILDNVKLYPIFTEFKRRVLDPIEEDFASVGYKATFVPSKTGKKTTGITFTIPREIHHLATNEPAKKLKAALPPAAENAPDMRVNKDEPAPLSPVVQVATTRLAGPPVQPAQTQDVKAKVKERLEALHVSQPQIKTILEVVQGEEELTKLLKFLFPLWRNLTQGEKEYTHENSGGKTVTQLKSAYPRLFAVWGK